MPVRLILLIILAAFITFIFVYTLKTSRKLPKTRMVTFAVLATILAWQGWYEFQWVQQEKAMAAAVSTIAGEEASVHCQRFSEALFYTKPELGHVKFGPDGVPEKNTMMTWETCRDFRNWLASDQTQMPTETNQILAVHILTHEAVHMYGETSEASTECYALQLMPWVAEALGASPEAADAMNLWYWEEMYPNLTKGYKSNDCKPGGPLDLDPRDEAWPRANNLPVQLPTPIKQS